MSTRIIALLLMLGLSGGVLVGCEPAEEEVELEEEGGELEVEEE